jgi:hypothetical protein
MPRQKGRVTVHFCHKYFYSFPIRQSWKVCMKHRVCSRLSGLGPMQKTPDFINETSNYFQNIILDAQSRASIIAREIKALDARLRN